MKKTFFALMLSAAVCATTSAFAMNEPDFKSTGIPTNFVKNGLSNVDILTDYNSYANYQAWTDQITIPSGKTKIEVDYTILVGAGLMSLGALNTAGNDWYNTGASNTGVAELVFGTGIHTSTITWLINPGDTKFRLVLRNYHLPTNGGPGISSFQTTSIKYKFVS